MSEPERLLDGSGNARARAILSAGLADAPPPDALPRVAAALGLAAGSVAVALPAAAALHGAGASAVVVASKAPVASGASVAVLSKWLAVGVLSGALVSGAVTVVEHVSAPRSSALPPAVVELSPAPRGPAVPPEARLNPTPETPEEPAPLVAEAPVSARHPPAAPSTSYSGALGVEAARIDAARRALARGDLEQTARELDAYQRERSVGVLDREALLLRIQLHVRRGDRDRAVILARSYLASHPNDAHASRLQALVESGGTTWPGPEGIER